MSKRVSGEGMASLDYDAISETYDAHRDAGPFCAVLADFARGTQAGTVLEVGCGTGNVSRALLERHPCRLVGVDRSLGMLRKACTKLPSVAWVHGEAEWLPVADGAADFLYAVYVLQHLNDLNAFFSECRRVLRRGTAAFVTAPQSFIRQHPMNRYFPSFGRIDGARFQPTDQVRTALSEAGFAETGIIHLSAPPQPIDRAYVKRVANKFISTYALLPTEEFEAGLRRLSAEVEEQGALDVPLVWECDVVWGRGL